MKIGGRGTSRAWSRGDERGQGETFKMAAMARLVARTLRDASQHLAHPEQNGRRSDGRRRAEGERLRSAILRMVEALELAAGTDAFENMRWDSADDPSSQELLGRLDAALDEVALSARNRRTALEGSALEGLEASLQPLEDEEAAQRLAWLARAQVAHQALNALNAHAQVNSTLARQALQRPILAASDPLEESLLEASSSTGDSLTLTEEIPAPAGEPSPSNAPHPLDDLSHLDDLDERDAPEEGNLDLHQSERGEAHTSEVRQEEEEEVADSFRPMERSAPRG